MSQSGVADSFSPVKAPWSSQLPEHAIVDIAELRSPSLLVFLDLVRHNLDRVLELVGGPDHWRPHCKTHKTREIVELQLQRGITRHKCATIAEAEMLATSGVRDILIAYPLVGPNQTRLGKLLDTFPSVRFMTLADHPALVQSLSQVATKAGRTLGVMLDLDSGMGRTGIPLNRSAIELYEMIATSDGLEPDGLHWYDGHNRHSDLSERRIAVLTGWKQLTRFRDQLLLSGLPVPRIVTGGSGSFAILAETGEPDLELSPGTTTLWDADMAERFPEMGLKMAAGILTRVVSLAAPDRLTLDIGHKACAADQPAGHRLYFPTIPAAREVQHSEEHLVLSVEHVEQFQLGDALLAFPRHVCPTLAVHQAVSVIEQGRVTATWPVAARDRLLTI